jgi:calcineurin-like phosphoesterase family protein
MNTWFTSDTHLGHANAIIYCKRPVLKPGDLDEKGKWSSPEINRERTREMDEIIIRNWNERVKPEDLVFHLGDFCFSRSSQAPDAPKSSSAFEYYKNRLNGNIIFIQGNHDVHNKIKSAIMSIVIKYGGHFVNLTHRPEHANSHYKYNFVGHVHNNWKICNRKINNKFTTLINVGVDVWDYRPISYNEIITAISRGR